MNFNQFACLTFDCYGTLIDWETGILGALRPLLEAHEVSAGDEELLELYGELEAAEERRSYRPYRDVLRGVVVALGDRMNFRPSLEQINSLPESLPQWPPFSDTVAALARLKQKYKLAVISNTDDDLFAETAKTLQVPFDWIITAQQAKSYKPSRNNFQKALEKIGLPKEKILHVGQSLYHDIVPTRELGWANVWVNRRSGKKGQGATVTAKIIPDLEVPDLKTLADLSTK
jgi:2-haloacid dehalogenase